MANWLVVIDEDVERRGSYVADVTTTICPVENLTVGSANGHRWSVVWALSQTAPLDVALDDGCSVVWGEARDRVGELQTAPSIRAAWRDGAVDQWDGYYSAIVIDETQRSLIAGADLLGIFPVYYWTDNQGVVLVGTSPELFSRHPRFVAEQNVRGLVGVLLTNGLVDGQTLWKDVRRLKPGWRVRVEGDRLWEDEAYEIPSGDNADDLPFSAHVDQLTDALATSVKRQESDSLTYGLLLSGGLDSRMIAAFLIRAGVKPNAMTLGLPSDLEMQCARAVAEHYGLDHVTGEPGANDYPEICRIAAKWEHLACGFTTVRDWWTQGFVGQLGPRLVTGGLADSLVGGTSLSWAYSEDTGSTSYENFVEQMPNLGISPDVCRRLLQTSGHADLVNQIEEELRREFESYGKRLSYCAWRYDLAHGQRYHVGGTAWRLSFGSWPVLPMLDRQVIETVANLPAASLADRDVQLALVETKLPELAGLPLDRSDVLSEEPEYLCPDASQVLAAALRRGIRPIKNLAERFLHRENRYWFRINNFNGELWRNARVAAEPQRSIAENIFDPDLLQMVLTPPSGYDLPGGPWVGESGRKLLLGYLYWAEDHLKVPSSATGKGS